MIRYSIRFNGMVMMGFSGPSVVSISLSFLDF